MSRKQRFLQKKFAVFCEGDTEFNYFDRMRKNQGVKLVLKPINMPGGGYSNFLQKIKIEAQSNYLAKFIVVDADRINSVPGEYTNFVRLLEYCKTQNRKGNTPHFLIVDNPDFEYVTCLHSLEYNGQDIHKFILTKLGIQDISLLKGKADIYDFLNSNGLSYEIMLEKVRTREKFVRNDYDIKKSTFEIMIKDTIVNYDMLNKKCSNIEELFDVIDW